jgi:hypothetical protein
MINRTAVLAAALGTVIASTLPAQVASQATPKQDHWEFLMTSGALMPTGSQRDAIRSAGLSAAQLTYLVKPSVAITSSFGWARSRDVAVANSPKLDVFTYDVGAELRVPRVTSSAPKSLTPFMGLGVGGRSYNYRKLDVDATHNASAYASVGGELGIRRVHLRLEARDYVSGFKPLAGAGAARTGNDVVVMAGLRIVSR